jgi:catechol 2,3-dioxygenase-like lactoylglutathione lyase family enzyme
MQPSLALVILAVDDLARARAFYAATLGWSATVEVPVYVELVGPGGMRLGLYDRERFGANFDEVVAAPPPGARTTELYFTVDDVDAAVEAARTAGARLLSAAAPRAWGDRVGYVADPDGNVIAFASALGG